MKHSKFKLHTSIYFFIVSCILFLSCSKDNDSVQTGDIKDIDGNTYHTITIGTQTWMRENLKVTRYRNGDPIANVRDTTEWYQLLTGAYNDYQHSNVYGEIYGRLYNWYAVNDPRKIAPVGWHIATDEEWATLTLYLGSDHQAGGKLKESGTTHWQAPNSGATNSSGFTALPSGNRDYTGIFENLGKFGYYWTSSNYNTESALARRLSYESADIFSAAFFKNNGYAVRCVKD